jgi:hypothetical protein
MVCGGAIRPQLWCNLVSVHCLMRENVIGCSTPLQGVADIICDGSP